MSVDVGVGLHPLQWVLGAVDDALAASGEPSGAALWSLGDREVNVLLVGRERAIGGLRARSLALLTEARRAHRGPTRSPSTGPTPTVAA